MRTGDKVRCVNSFGCDTLSFNAVYTVLGVRTNPTTGNQVLHLQTPTCLNWYQSSRFRLVEESSMSFNKNDVVTVRGVHGLCVVLEKDGVYIRVKDKYGDVYTQQSDGVKLVERTLKPEEVAKIAFEGGRLEYLYKGDWKPVTNYSMLTVVFMQTAPFRKAVEVIDYYGTNIPKPIEDVSEHNNFVYGISFTKAKVYKVHSRYVKKVTQCWNTPEQAQEALVAILKPFGTTIQPLDKRLLEG